MSAVTSPEIVPSSVPSQRGETGRHMATQARFAKPQRSYWDVIVAIFVGLILISNVTASKLFYGPHVPGFSDWFYGGGRLIFDGGAFLFPLSYVVGDIMTEVYGWRAKRAIWLGFAMNFLMAITFRIVAMTTPMEGFEAWNQVLAPVTRLTIAGLAGYLCGEFLNSYVVVGMKRKHLENKVAFRLISSTVVAEFVDTALFCTIAYAGTISLAELSNYTITGYVYKVGVELLIVPLSLAAIRWLKRHEPTYESPTARLGNV